MTDAGTEPALRLVGTTLRGKWHLDALIGMGGMANVYAATHRNGRRGAVKLLNRTFSADREVRERFMREGYVANRIHHPGVVSILDDDEAEDGSAFLVMELLQGESLYDRIRQQGRLDPAEALFVTDQMLDVLAAAHRARVIHRDIKPGNVFLLRDGRVKVLDFGLARVLDGIQQAALTREGVVLGTVAYMSPEQARATHKDIDERSDLYSVGATLFFLLSGAYIHEAGSPMDRLMAAMRNPARSLATAVAGLPESLVEVVDHSVRSEKADRYQTAEEMQAAIRAVFAQITGRPIPTTQRVSLGGLAGWARPTTPDLLSTSRDLASAALSISVVFEPDELQDGVSVPLEITASDIQSVSITLLSELDPDHTSVDAPIDVEVLVPTRRL